MTTFAAILQSLTGQQPQQQGPALQMAMADPNSPTVNQNTPAFNMSGANMPGSALPTDSYTPQNILQALQAPQQQMSEQPQQVPGDMSVGGDPASLSGRIQEWLGAKPADQGGTVQDLLSGRFQPQITTQDALRGGIASMQAGGYVPAQQFANERMKSAMDNLESLAKVQYLAKGGSSGGSSVFAQTLAAINADPTLANLSPMDKIRLAQNKLGTNLTMGANGQVSDMNGAAQGLGNLAYGEKSGGELGQKRVDLQYNPAIAGGEADARNNSTINTAIPIATNEKVGGALGDAKASLIAQNAQLPRLEQVTQQLSDLGKKATYTQAGQLFNTATRQVGLPVSQGAIARSEYISKVNNEVLPLLRQTFGAQFTEMEGERLMATLGDPNISPPEKDAVLRSFIDQKKAQVQTLARQTGENIPDLSAPSQSNAPPVQGATQAPDGNWYVPDPSRQGKYLMVQP